MMQPLLKVNGKAYGGWKEIKIQRSLNQMCGFFSLIVSDKTGGSFKDLGFKIGHSCTIEYGDNILANGYVDDFDISYSFDRHMIRIGGRDKTCDLIDCSYVPYQATKYANVSEWKKKPIIDIIKDLCYPFEIDVVVDSNTSSIVQNDIQEKKSDKVKFESFNTEGETVGELITKMCLTRGILPICYGDGKLTLTRAGERTTLDKLELGKNILRGSLSASNRDRYSYYIVKGQGLALDTIKLPDYMSPSFYKSDPIMVRSRYRPIIVIAETATNIWKCIERANWEYARRIGNSRKIVYEVQGWTQSDNKTVWPLNALVFVKDKFFSLNEELLISEIEYTISEELGTLTKITLENPYTYHLLEKPMELGFNIDLAEGEENTPDPWWAF